jgi:hypothetical protein
VSEPNLKVTWVDRGFEPTCKADPNFPDGMDLDLSQGKSRACVTELPYPAKRCGYFVINCTDCGLQAVVTTAGRRDDPRSVLVACREIDRFRRRDS